MHSSVRRKAKLFTSLSVMSNPKIQSEGIGGTLHYRLSCEALLFLPIHKEQRLLHKHSYYDFRTLLCMHEPDVLVTTHGNIA